MRERERERERVFPFTLCVKERAGVSVPFALWVRVDADLKRSR